MYSKKRSFNVVFRDAQLCVRNRIWSPRRDERAGALIGTGGTWRSDWPKMHALHVRNACGFRADCF